MFLGLGSMGRSQFVLGGGVRSPQGWRDRHIRMYMGGCQNYGPFLGTLNIRCRIMIGIQKGTIILITTHIRMYMWDAKVWDFGV